MAFKLFDRVQETSTTTGTGDFTLSGAVTGFKTFASRYSTGDTLYYAIQEVSGGVPTGAWEIGLGTYSAANTLTRTTVMASSNSDAAVSFAAGDKQVFVTLTALQGASIRERLTVARTYYVRTDGSDSNNGLANTSGGAFLTIQKAIEIVADTLDISTGITVTIQVGDGTYTGNVACRTFTGAGAVTIQGNTGAMSNVVISPTTGTGFSNTSRSLYVLRYVKITTSNNSAIYCANNAQIFYDNIDFGSTGTAPHIYTEASGRIQSTGNSTISGGGYSHFQTSGAGSEIRETGSYTCTLTGTPAFSGAFVIAGSLAFVQSQSVTYSGSSTGKRYANFSNSVIHTNGGGANYFPGSVAGDAPTTGAQYL